MVVSGEQLGSGRTSGTFKSKRYGPRVERVLQPSGVHRGAEPSATVPAPAVQQRESHGLARGASVVSRETTVLLRPMVNPKALHE